MRSSNSLTGNLKVNNRVSLRKLSSSDLEYFYLWASDPEVAKTMTWDAYTSKEDAKKFLIDVVDRHPFFYAICFDGVPVGSVTLNKAELGYVLSRAYWGQGITTAAVKQVIQMKGLALTRIEALVDPDNIASQRVLIKAGMTCEGLLKDHVRVKGQLKDRYLYSLSASCVKKL